MEGRATFSDLSAVAFLSAVALAKVEAEAERAAAGYAYANMFPAHKSETHATSFGSDRWLVRSG